MKISWKKIAAFTLSEIMVVLVVISIVALATFKITASRTDYIYKYMHAGALRNLKRGIGELIADGIYDSATGKTIKQLPTMGNVDGTGFCQRFAELTNTVGTINCAQTVEDGTTDFSNKVPNFIASNGIKFYNFGSNATGTAPLQLYKVYLDIDGPKGTSTLNKDVWPFWINVKGQITAIPPTDPTCQGSNVHYEQRFLSGTDILIIDNDSGATCNAYPCGLNPPSDMLQSLQDDTVVLTDKLSGYTCSTHACGSGGKTYAMDGAGNVIVKDTATGVVCTAQGYVCGAGPSGNSTTYSLSGNTVTKIVTDLTSSQHIICSSTTYVCGGGPGGKKYTQSGSNILTIDLTSSPNLTCDALTYTCGSSTSPGTGSTSTLQGTNIVKTDKTTGYTCTSYACGAFGFTYTMSGTTISFIDNLSTLVCNTYACGLNGTKPITSGNVTYYYDLTAYSASPSTSLLCSSENTYVPCKDTNNMYSTDSTCSAQYSGSGSQYTCTISTNYYDTTTKQFCYTDKSTKACYGSSADAACTGGGPTCTPCVNCGTHESCTITKAYGGGPSQTGAWTEQTCSTNDDYDTSMVCVPATKKCLYTAKVMTHTSSPASPYPTETTNATYDCVATCTTGVLNSGPGFSTGVICTPISSTPTTTYIVDSYICYSSQMDYLNGNCQNAVATGALNSYNCKCTFQSEQVSEHGPECGSTQYIGGTTCSSNCNEINPWTSAYIHVTCK